MTRERTLSFRDLVGPEEAAAAQAAMPDAKQRAKVRGRTPRRTKVTKIAGHLTGQLANTEEQVQRLEVQARADDADRETRIKAKVSRVLVERLKNGVNPMDYKRLSLELAHYNMVHLGGEAIDVMMRIAEYARDPTSEHHEWALKFMGERILPAKMAQEAMLAAAGLSEKKDGGQQKPTVIINIGEATPMTLQQEREAIDVIPE